MILKIKVRSNSKKEEIKKISDDELIVSLKEKAENNKANIELLKLLKKHFKKHAEIIKGKANKNKIVKLE